MGQQARTLHLISRFVAVGPQRPAWAAWATWTEHPQVHPSFVNQSQRVHVPKILYTWAKSLYRRYFQAQVLPIQVHGPSGNRPSTHRPTSRFLAATGVSSDATSPSCVSCSAAVQAERTTEVGVLGCFGCCRVFRV